MVLCYSLTNSITTYSIIDLTETRSIRFGASPLGGD